MTKSLRQRLQLWHAIILSSVLVVFALAFYRQLHHATMSEIDGELVEGVRRFVEKRIAPHSVPTQQEQRAKVIEAEAEVPRAMAAALREGKLGVMDYYEMKNTIADTAMRDSIASMGEGANAPRKK